MMMHHSSTKLISTKDIDEASGGQSAKSMALMPEMDLLSTVEVCLRMDLVGESFLMMELCLRMDWGFLGEEGSGVGERSFLEAMLLRTMSTGTGLIMTLEVFFLELKGGSLGAFFGPQLMSLEDLMISGAFCGEASTFSLRRRRRFLMPLLFIMRAISSSWRCFLRASSSPCPDFFLLPLRARLATKELSRELQMLPRDWLRADSFFLEREESELSLCGSCWGSSSASCLPCPLPMLSRKRLVVWLRLFLPLSLR